MRHKTMRMQWVPNWLTATVVSYNLADACTLIAHKLWNTHKKNQFVSLRKEL